MDAYEAVILDLDGVLFRGDQPIPAAQRTIEAVRGLGKRVAFLTNNSARTPEQIVEKLSSFGIAATADEVVTSAQATAELLASEADGDATAYVIGQDGVRAALREAGIELVDGARGTAAFVVVGWDGGVTYEALRRATVQVRAGARLVATNADASYPAPGGELWPGAGAILAAVETAAGKAATVVGKPHRPLFETAVSRVGTRKAVVVGDRLETDIAGAVGAGLDAALVLSGVSRLRDLLDHDAVPVGILEDVGELLADRSPVSARPAAATDLGLVRELTEAPASEPARGPEGVWVVDAGGGLASTATVEVRDDDAYLRAVATRPDERGTGLGSLAVAAAIGGARGAAASRVWLLTETAAGFFERLGFERVDRAALPEWIQAGPAEACPASAVAMRRELPQYGSQSGAAALRR